MKYNDTSISIIWRGQSHLDPYTDFVSTRLYPVAFHHCIKNLDSPIPKCSELLVSYYSNLRFEGHLYPCASQAVLDNRMLSKWVICSVTIYSYISLVCHTSVTHSLVKRTTNPYGLQWPPLDKRLHPVKIYHLVTNIFKSYTINSLFIVR